MSEEERLTKIMNDIIANINSKQHKRMHEHKAKHQEAVAIMEMSEDFSKSFRRVFEIFGDLYSLIGKNLTPYTFWFYVDALHFNVEKDSQPVLQHIRDYISRDNCYEFDEIEDLEFIMKMRILVSRQKMGTLNLDDIRSTSIDEVIALLESNLESVDMENCKKLENWQQAQQRNLEEIDSHFQKFGIKFRYSHPMFYYQEFEAALRSKWREESNRTQNKQKCYLCSSPKNLMTCNKCQLKVHETCYPTFALRTDNKAMKPSEEELRNFVCENCVHHVDVDNQKCELCCCRGGHFVRVSHQQECSTAKVVFQKENIGEDNRSMCLQLKEIPEDKEGKQNFAHLTCFVWNTELKWNIHRNEIEVFNRNVKKKQNGICSFCGISYGITIPCSNETCRRFYHGECARRHNLEMNLIRAKTSIIEIYCERHRHLSKSEALEENSINKFKEVKKMFQHIDKEIKRLNVMSSYQQVKLVAERDYCCICGKEEGREKIAICKQCWKWYHTTCATTCKNCS